MVKKLQEKCANCGILFEQNNDDLKTDICKKCQDPIKAEARKKLNPNYVDPDTTFEKRINPFQKWNIINYIEREGRYARFNPNLLATAIMQQIPFKVCNKTSLFYNYNSQIGIWQKNTENLIKAIVKKILKTKYKPSHYSNILDSILADSITNVKFNNKLIGLKNGYLDPITQKLIAFTKEEMVFYSIPIKYDKKADCPNFRAFINDVLDPEESKLIQEFSGLILLPDYRFHKILWIVGTGRNGKSVFGKTLKAMVGDHSSHVGLEELDGNHRFSLQHLYGSLLNLINEPTSKKSFSTEILKMITEEDSLSAELKGKNEKLFFTNCAKNVIIGNLLPKTKDKTLAFKERILFLRFEREFVGENQIEQIEKNWLVDPDQRSGILNWMLEGFKRVLEKHGFTKTKTQAEMWNDFLKTNNPGQAFLNEKCEIISQSHFVLRDVLYNNFKNYCEENGLEILTKPQFTKILKRTPRVFGKYKKINGKTERVWNGIRLKSNIQDTENTPLYTQEKINKKYEKVEKHVSFVSSVLFHGSSKRKNSEIKNSENPILTRCYFSCGKPLPKKGWVSGPLSENKLAHTSCYSQKERELIERELEK